MGRVTLAVNCTDSPALIVAAELLNATEVGALLTTCLYLTCFWPAATLEPSEKKTLREKRVVAWLFYVNIHRV